MAPGARTDLRADTKSRAAERIGKRYGMSPRNVVPCARAANVSDVITTELSIDAREGLVAEMMRVLPLA